MTPTDYERFAADTLRAQAEAAQDAEHEAERDDDIMLPPQYPPPIWDDVDYDEYFEDGFQ